MSLNQRQESLELIINRIRTLERAFQEVNQCVKEMKGALVQTEGKQKKEVRRKRRDTYTMDATDKESVEHTRPIALTLRSNKRSVGSWADLLEEICILLIEKDCFQFSLAARECKQSHGFSDIRVEKKHWREIKKDAEDGTGFYFYPSLQADESRLTILQLLSYFGYKKAELIFELSLKPKFLPKHEGKVPQSWKQVGKADF